MNGRIDSISLNLNGLRFDALTCGPADGELVILLHGFPQFADAWSAVMPALAAEGYRAIAPDQRGYSAGARPSEVEDYRADNLVADVIAILDTLGSPSCHVVGHDWGGFLAWKLAAEYPNRVRSVSSLSTPHIDAFCEAIANDADQKARSQYIDFFKMPGHVAESFLLKDDAARLRGVYQGKVPEAQVSSSVRRLSEPGALTAALNWYRALDLNARIGKIHIPALYVWGDQDQALGRAAAVATAGYVDAPCQFETLAGCSHWLLDEVPDQIGKLVPNHLHACGK